MQPVNEVILFVAADVEGEWRIVVVTARATDAVEAGVACPLATPPDSTTRARTPIEI